MYGHHHPFSPHGGPRRPQQQQQQPPPNYFSVPQPPLNPYLQYPNPYLQNPAFSTPPPPLRGASPFFPNTTPQTSHSPNEILQRIEQAVSKAHRDLLASGESVSAWKVAHSVLLSLKADSWNSLGFQMQQIPSLFRLMLVEGKVNAFIHCFVGVRRITSLHDLDVEICKNEGVQRFDELELGPLLRHPLVIHYFLVPSDTKEIVNITSEEIISHLVEFMDSKTHKGIKAEEFLDFLALKRSLPVKEKLGIRIQNLRMHVNSIREARKTEDSTLHKCIQSMKMTPKESNVENKMTQPSISLQKKALRKRYFSISRRIESFSPLHKASAGKHVRFVSSSSDDEVDDDDVDDEDLEDEDMSSSQCKVSSENKNISDQRVTRCPYPSASEEKARMRLRIDLGEQSPPDKKREMSTKGYPQKSSAKKRKHENQNVNNPLKLSKRENAQLSGHDLELQKDSDVGKSHCTESQSVIDAEERKKCLMLTDDAIEQFITTWKDACGLHSVPEVFDRMLGSYTSTSRGKRKVRTMFKSFPYIGLLHVAVKSIKYGMWDTLYDSFQAIGETTHTEPENISIEPSSERDALSIKEHSIRCDPSISMDDISKKASTYFELDHTTTVEGKSPLERQFKFLRKLHDWQTWLTKQFSVKEFGSLGHGDFYRFLESHPFLIPNELLESLFGDLSKKSSFEISMCQHQMVMLLSQAASFLQEKETLTKEHVCKLMARQFPVISLKLSDDASMEDFSEFVKKHKKAENSSSIVFSATLLGTGDVRHSLVQKNINLLENTGVKLDVGLISGALGSVSAKEAVQCLLKAPLLSDLQLWSHWDLIYAPTLGPLVEWLLAEVHMKELLCLVTKDGKIIRLDNSATIDEFLEALLRNNPYETAVKLSSLFALYGGERHVPLSLLKCHARRGIENILINSMDLVTAENNSGSYTRNGEASTGQYAPETTHNQLLNIPGKRVVDFDVKDEHRFNRSVPVASRFILDCLCYLPSEFRSLAADLLLSGLQSFMKNASLSILHECSETHQRLMLHEIGLSLNICEWIADYSAFSSGTANDFPESVGATTCFLNSKIRHKASNDLLISNDKMAIDVKSDKHIEVIDEVLDNEVNVSTAKSGGRCKSSSSACDGDQDGTLIIESIRREEFGLVSGLAEADNLMLKKQHARLGRALQCLSQELYSQDSHFLLELVQNADDNLYSENVEPTLVFILQSSGIVVLNNEQGFTAKNIKALCDVGNSTKKGSNAGYIGHKGIGFKSVFRVTDAPEIHSKGFNVKFDISEGQIGFVLPTVVSPCDIVSLRRQLPDEANHTDNCWNTCIVLPFKQKLREGMGLSSIVSLFSDLHPSLLLFLHRLQCIKFKNMLNDTYTVMKRETLDDGIVKVSHGGEIMSWFVASQNLQASVIRPDVQTTKISVAFTLKESSDGEYRPHLEQQPVFAFLPLRTYGLKFILQGDFNLPSSREEVDADSAWNQWLLSEFPGLFVSAQISFCDLHCFQESPGRAVAAYMSFVPLVGEVHGFFSQLPRMIISKLRVSNCLLVEGKEEWVPPCSVLRGWNEQARILIPDSVLHQHLGLGYLNKDIFLSDSLAKALGVYEYGPRIIVEIMSSICSKGEAMKSFGLNWLSCCLSALYMMLVHPTGQGSVDAWVEADLIEMLRKIPFVPLSDGTYSSTAEGAIWLTCDDVICGAKSEHEHEAFSSLYANLRLVSPAFFSAASVNTYGLEDLTVDNVIKMLLKVGVQRLAAHELIKVHILPALSDDRTAERNNNLMTEYLSFVMLHLQTTCPSCHTERDTIISKLQTRAFILTNHGYKRPAEAAIHFSREFGNSIDMTKLIEVMDSDWHEVDDMYLKHSSDKSLPFGLLQWREFFQELGITDFVQTVQVERSIADLSPTLINDIMSKRDLVTSGIVGKDWASPELVNLLSILSTQKNQEKSKYLVEVLDKMWDNCFHAKVTGCCINKSDEEGKIFRSSFINSFNDVQWMASSKDQKLHYPKDLFFDCEEVRSILGNFAPYAVPQVTSKVFSSDIGLKNSVTINDALEIFQDLRSFEGPVTTSIDQMSKLYTFLWVGMDTAKAEISRGLTSGPSIFVPFAVNYKPGDVISGKLFSAGEVYWNDPTGCVDLTKEMLLQCGSLNETNYSINKTLAHVYPSLRKFFVNECMVCEISPPRSYVQILVQLSKVALPSQAANAVLCVFLKWANDLKSGLLKPEDVVYLKELLLESETTMLPTVQDKWVSLHPTFGLVCWSDNEELWKQFKHSSNIHFLHFGEHMLGEKEDIPAKISCLMQALGVPSLSEVITREAIFYGMDDCREKALLVNWVLPYAQRYIYKMHPEKYIQLKQSGFQNICNLRIVLVEKLFYRHTVKGSDNASNRRTECCCLLQENNLYVVRASDSHPIFMELSRLFFNGTPELHLANFLHMITTMAESGSTGEQTEIFVVNSQKIPRIPDEEPVWFLSSLSSQQADVGNTEPGFVSATSDEQNSKFKRKPGTNTNWPPADWKTAPDFGFARENRLRTKSALPPADRSQQEDKIEALTCIEDHELPTGTSGDWIIEDNTALVLQDMGAREDQPLYGTSGIIFGRATSSSDESYKAVGATTDSEYMHRSHFNERDQLSFGTPNEYQTAATGRKGELVAFRYFVNKVSGASVKWVNEVTETGLPYDIVIGDGEESKEYIEVKATISARKDWFTISTREWQFAVDRGDSFSIAHVYITGQNNAKVTVFKNPVRLCQQGVLRLAILMPKGQDDPLFIT